MIPYDELCAQLAQWRSRNGMHNGASANPRMREPGAAPQQQYVPPSYSPPPVAAAPTSAPPRQSAPYAATPSPVPQFTPPQGYGAVPAAYAAQQFSPPGGYAPPEPADLPPPEDEPPSLFGNAEVGDMTEIRGTPAPARDDQTGEIDIDSIDVVDEEEAP